MDEAKIGKGKKFKAAIRKAAALVLSKRFRTRGAPSRRLEQIFKAKDIPMQLGLREMRKELDDVGVKLKEIEEPWRGKTITRYLGVIDPKIELDDVRPYNRNITAILALISAKGPRVPFSDVREEVNKIVNDEERAEDLLSSSLKKLREDDLLQFDKEKGVISLTDYGQALLPSEEQIKKIMIETLVAGKKDENTNETSEK